MEENTLRFLLKNQFIEYRNKSFFLVFSLQNMHSLLNLGHKGNLKKIEGIMLNFGYQFAFVGQITSGI